MRVEVTGVKEVVSKLKEIQEKFPPVLSKGVEQAGFMIEREAKQRCPVDTGKLKQSIFTEVSNETEAVVSANMPYSAYVEYGTSKMNAQPFMRPAANIVGARYGMIMTTEIKKVL